MKKTTLFLFGLLFIFWGCKSTKNVSKNNLQTINLDTVKVSASRKPKVYQGSETKYFNLINTKLDVSFNWEKQYLYGKATLKMTPYFYPQDSVILDAKGFDIHKVSLLNGPDLKYNYDGNKLRIKLDKQYTRQDTFQIFIDYTAKPNERKSTEGSSAITSHKGLFFINPLGKDPNKPKEIWTQGETQDNSAWFPTFDSPNFRTHEEINMTVDTQYVTLSNGLLTYSEMNGNGTRTDHWKMNKPIAPYLFMMAVGKFSIIHDKWTKSNGKTINVDYYLEPKYAPYAKEIFGNTPEMLSFYSKILGVEYPWSKFDQIVVRDYVSGAMENTTAVIHGSFLQKTARQLLDGNSDEYVIAHELFHHWFGDYVTCESWSNIPLNESFADYGEYLWIQHKYGQNAADYHLEKGLNDFLARTRGNQVPLIRYYYNPEKREKLFDVNSYQKGGSILNMLRHVVGDSAFFESLHYYLEKNKLSSVEVANLRLAFEHVTGRDLNWFFNEWFFQPGYPKLNISYGYNDSLKKAYVFVDQNQDLSKFPLYKLPVAVDLYYNGKKVRYNVIVDKTHQVFKFPAPVKPDLINFDGDKMLLCSKTDDHSEKEWAFMYKHGKRYLDRYEALEALTKDTDALSNQIMIAALSDKFWNLRNEAINHIVNAIMSDSSLVENKLKNIAQHDEKTSVRANAIKALSIYYSNDESVKNLILQTVKDSSYDVIESSLIAMRELDSEKAYKMAEKFDHTKSDKVSLAVGEIFADAADSTKNQFFLNRFRSDDMGKYYKYSLARSYGHYLNRMPTSIVNTALPLLKKESLSAQQWWLKLGYIKVLLEQQSRFGDEIKKLKTANKTNSTTYTSDNNTLQKINDIIDELKKKITDPQLKTYLGSD